jgi:hypothetical protein
VLILISIFLLILTFLSLLIIRLARPTATFTWLFAIIAFLLAWPMLLLSQVELPLAESAQIVAPADLITWSFSLGLGSLALAAALTEIAHPENRASGALFRWSVWPAALLITAFGLLAFLLHHLLGILFAWAALDLIELAIWFKHLPASQRDRAIFAFSARMTGLFLAIFAAIWTVAVSQPDTAALNLANLPPQASLILLIAGGIRLGLAPPNAPLPGVVQHRSLNTLLQLTTAAASLAVMVRLPSPTPGSPILTGMIVLTICAGLYGSLAWLGARNEAQGLPFFILGIAALASGSALNAQPQAGISWSMALLLGGGLSGLFSVRRRWLAPLLLLEFVWISGLPFTPTWVGMNLYEGSFFAAPFYMAIHAALLFGFLKHGLRPETESQDLERWVWLLYPWGLAILPIVHFLINWVNAAPVPGLLPSLAALLVVGSVALLIFIQRRRPLSIPIAAQQRLVRLLSFGWFYRALWSLYYYLRRFFALVNTLLEGQAGVLWALLVLALLLSLIGSVNLEP